jgi:phage recombination protein Bet
MAVTNSLAKKAATDLMAFEYDSNGEKVKLSPATVRNYLVNGGGNVTDQEVMMYLTLCRYQHLNPFLKEVYLIKYGNSPATIVTGKDLFMKRANRNPNYAGKKAGIIVASKENGAVTEREGTVYIPETEELIGGWAKVYIKGHTEPEYASVSFNEYAGRKSDGTLNSQWATKPATMIRKVALVQALREAFPEDFGGLYSPEEMGNQAAVVLDDAAPTQPVEIPAEAPKETPKAEAEEIPFA